MFLIFACRYAAAQAPYTPSVCSRYFTETLSNGLMVMVVEDSSRTFESLTLVYPGGYDRQHVVKPGLDDVAAPLLFSEAARHGASDYFWEIRPAYRRFSFTVLPEKISTLAAYISKAPAQLSKNKNLRATINRLVKRDNEFLDDAPVRDLLSVFGESWELAALKAPAYAYTKITEADLAEYARGLNCYAGALVVFRGPLDHFFCMKLAAEHWGKNIDYSPPPPPVLVFPEEKEHYLASLAPTLVIHAIALDTTQYRRFYPLLEFLRFRLEHDCEPLYGKASLKTIVFSQTVLVLLILERAYFEHAAVGDVFGANDDMARRYAFEHPYRLEARLTDSYLDEYLTEMMLLGRAEDFCRRTKQDFTGLADEFFNLPYLRIYGLP